MEIILLGIIVMILAGGIMSYIVFIKLNYDHYVVIGRDEQNTTFKVVNKDMHNYSPEAITERVCLYMGRDTIANKIHSHKASFYTYSKSGNVYAKVLIAPAGYLTTQMDSHKDNNINELPILIL